MDDAMRDNVSCAAVLHWRLAVQEIAYLCSNVLGRQ